MVKNNYRELNVPYNFQLRDYQESLYDHFPKEYISNDTDPETRLKKEELNKHKYNRAYLIKTRRYGFDLLALNITVKESQKRSGIYYHIFPTYAQGKKDLWNNKTKDGIPFLDYIPREIIDGTPNITEMMIRFTNGSIYQVVGSDNYSSLRGAGVVGVVFSEWAFQDPNCLSVISPILAENNGWALFGTTPFGYNHAYKDYVMAKNNPDYYCEIRKVNETVYYEYSNNGEIIKKQAVPQEAIEAERRRGMSETEINREYYCFPPDTPILTKDGLKEISKIEIGDIVLTHANRWRAVKNVIAREYKGEMIRIKSYGTYEDILCTSEHPIRIYNRPGYRVSQKHKWIYKWVKAKDIKDNKKRKSEDFRSDQVVFPRLKNNKPIISEALIKLIGWYITEGSIIRNAVHFSMNKNETIYISEIINSANELKLSIATIETPTTTLVQIRNSQFADFLICYCGKGAKNKKIPLQMICGNVKLLFDTLIAGDGCKTKEGWTYSTISKTLAYQIQILSTTIGYGSGITRRKYKSKGIICGREVNLNESYNVQIRNTKNQWLLRPSCYGLAATVKETSLEEYDGIVYNLNVEFDNSYIAYGRMVHNCSFEAGVVGSIYANELNIIRNNKQICRVPTETNLPVYTFWDLGIDGSTAIWFAQFLGREVHLINYYSNSGEGLLHYANYIKDWRDKNMITYEEHILPHDAKNRQLESAKSVGEILEEYGLKCDVVKRPANKEDAIETVRQYYSRFWFDEINCKNGIDGLMMYRREYNEENKVYAMRAVKDWSTHPSDALQTLVLWLQKDMPDTRPNIYKYADSSYNTDPQAWMGR